MKEKVKNSLRSALQSPTALAAAMKTVDALTAGMRRKATQEKHILVCPPGGGNIGDQAMVDAFIRGHRGEAVTLIVRAREDLRVEHLDAATDVDKEILPHLVYARLPEFIADYWRWKKILQHARSVSVIGADIMDGAYNPVASMMRANLAASAARLGIDAKIIGFSWNGKPHSVALSAILRADREGVVSLLRDPISYDRIAKTGVSNARQVADVVFSDHASVHGTPDLDVDGKYVVVNASALVARSQNQTAAFSSLIGFLRSRDYSVVLLPHVLRGGRDDDLSVCREIYSHWEHDASVRLIDRELTPDQVRYISGSASFVVTGRMHLAVMALSQRVPAVVVATQGKVEGLMQLFDLSTFVVPPGPELARGISEAAESLHNDLRNATERIDKALPSVTESASMNLSPQDAL